MCNILILKKPQERVRYPCLTEDERKVMVQRISAIKRPPVIARLIPELASAHVPKGILNPLPSSLSSLPDSSFIGQPYETILSESKRKNQEEEKRQ